MRLIRLLCASTILLAWGAALAANPPRVMVVTWNGCEQACQGFQDYLKERGLEVDYRMRDAGGQSQRLAEIRDEAFASPPDLILTYGTNVSRAIAGTLAEAGGSGAAASIPKVFMIVADPVAAGLIKSLDEPGRPDLTGTFNRVPETVNIETIRSYLPAFKRLGMLVNADEKNSLVKRDEMAALGRDMGFELISAEIALAADGKPQAQDIAPKLAQLKAKGADFIYLGSSSFLREQREVFTRAALSESLPVLSPYELVVRDSQALISVAARYYEVGRLAGEQARRILQDGVPAGRLPVARMTRFAVTINMSVAKKLGKIPPIELLQIAETVN